MGLFNKRKKNEKEAVIQPSQEVKNVDADKEISSEKVDLTSSEAVNAKLKEIYQKDSLYIVLNIYIADLERGLSVPLVLMPKDKEDHKVMVVFTDYEKAKTFVTQKRPMVIDGILPIAEIKKDDKINNMDIICANAMAQGINAIDFDVDDDNGFGCKLQYFMQINNMSGQGQIVFSNEEMEKIKANGGKFTPRFNAMYIMNFDNPYSLSKERAEEVVNVLLEDDGIEKAEECTIHELCYGANKLMYKAAEAEKNKDTQECERLKGLVDDLNEVIFNKLSELKQWYTLKNKETGEIYTKNGAAYIIYTPRYGNRMPQGTVLEAFPASVAEFAYLVGNSPVNMVVVTDGPNIMHLIDRGLFGF